MIKISHKSTSHYYQYKRSALLMISIIITAISSVTYLLYNYTKANQLADFKPGNIMSDFVMGNHNTMTEAQIQSFLKSKNHCNNRNIAEAKKYPNVQYHIRDGHFVCMADDLFNGETAAHIIWQAAQDYRINPQVLLVLLEKEQGLITDTWPNHIQYRSATGFGCPDTAACDAKYYGLKNQIRHAAKLFRSVLDGGWTNYPVGPNYVQYNPNVNCGGSNVYIENRATSALYRYTPYQPNAGALAAGYGTAPCGAYGNRNFYLYFKNWFGNPTANQPPKPLADVLEGDYLLVPKHNSSTAISLAQNSADNKVLYAKKQRQQNQLNIFSIKRTADKTYQITNNHTKKVIDVPGANFSAGVILNQYHINHSSAQQWSFHKHDDGSVSIIPHAAQHLAIDLSKANPSLNHNNYSDAQQRFYLINLKSAKLANDTYILTTTSDLAIDIAGGAEKAQNGTKIQTWTYNASQAQKFQLRYDQASDYYEIVNPHTNKAIDVAQASTANNASINLYKRNFTCAQKWNILRHDRGYVIVSACSDKLLTTPSSAKGSKLTLHQTKPDLNNQIWLLTKANDRPVANGDYILKSALGNNLAIDVAGGSEKAKIGTNIQLWRHNQTPAQDFTIHYHTATNNYSIVNSSTKLVLSIDGTGKINQENIFLDQPNNTCQQRWSIQHHNNYYRLLSTCSNKIIDVAGGKPVAGSNINIYHDNGTAAQNWQLIKK